MFCVLDEVCGGAPCCWTQQLTDWQTDCWQADRLTDSRWTCIQLLVVLPSSPNVKHKNSFNHVYGLSFLIRSQCSKRSRKKVFESWKTNKLHPTERAVDKIETLRTTVHQTLACWMKYLVELLVFELSSWQTDPDRRTDRQTDVYPAACSSFMSTCWTFTVCLFWFVLIVPEDPEKKVVWILKNKQASSSWK